MSHINYTMKLIKLRMSCIKLFFMDGLLKVKTAFGQGWYQIHYFNSSIQIPEIKFGSLCQSSFSFTIFVAAKAIDFC